LIRLFLYTRTETHGNIRLNSRLIYVGGVPCIIPQEISYLWKKESYKIGLSEYDGLKNQNHVYLDHILNENENPTLEYKEFKHV